MVAIFCAISLLEKLIHLNLFRKSILE